MALAVAPDPKEKAPKDGAGAVEFTENENAGAVDEVGLSNLADVEELKLNEEPELDEVVVAPEEIPNEKALVGSILCSFSLLTPIVFSGLVC